MDLSILSPKVFSLRSVIISYKIATLFFLILCLNTSNAQSSFSFNTSGDYSWTVPANVTSIKIIAVGASGGGTDGGEGLAAMASGSGISVSPGNMLNVVVGEAGEDGNFAAGGGGGSAVYNNSTGTALIIAGGGGGSCGGPGGLAGITNSALGIGSVVGGNATTMAGGKGGDASTSSGGNGGMIVGGTAPNSGNGGFGYGGGGAGYSTGFSLIVGGGGGGGATGGAGGSGGTSGQGGSSYVINGANASFEQATTIGDGSVTIIIEKKVPTLSEWGGIVLGLLLLTISLVAYIQPALRKA